MKMRKNVEAYLQTTSVDVHTRGLIHVKRFKEVKRKYWGVGWLLARHCLSVSRSVPNSGLKKLPPQQKRVIISLLQYPKKKNRRLRRFLTCGCLQMQSYCLTVPSDYLQRLKVVDLFCAYPRRFSLSFFFYGALSIRPTRMGEQGAG